MDIEHDKGTVGKQQRGYDFDVEVIIRFMSIISDFTRSYMARLILETNHKCVKNEGFCEIRA